MSRPIKTRGLFLLSLLFLLLFSSPVLAEEKSSKSDSKVQTYDQLLHAIRQVKAASQGRIEQAVEQEKVREAWETGKLIDEHVLQHKKRADYGEQVIIRLAKDLGTSETELRFTLQFARTYPIHWPADELSWSHYQSLMALNDPEERKEVAGKAAKEKWNRDRVREEVRKRKVAKNPNADTQVGAIHELPLRQAKPGKVGVYRVVEMEGKKYYDLGFSTYFELKGRKKPKQTHPPESDLYTYSAQVTQVTDGDTFHALIDLGFGIILEQRLRLRQLDAPEIVSREGKEAQALLEKILKRDHGKILIKTTKSDDQYGRYLVDVFLPGRDIKVPPGGPQASKLEGTHGWHSIDQELLASGLLTLRAGE